jgi:hypothetical protein
MVEGSKFRESHIFENTKLESKGEGNASTFSSALPTSSSLARFRRVSSRVIFTADHSVMPAVRGSKKIPTLLVYVTRQSASSGSSKAYFSTNLRTLINRLGAPRSAPSAPHGVWGTTAYGTHLYTKHIYI